jgi:hypothetical protein
MAECDAEGLGGSDEELSTPDLAHYTVSDESTGRTLALTGCRLATELEVDRSA